MRPGVSLSPEDAETWERHSGAASSPLGGYRRREPEKTLLHQVVRERLEPFLAAARERSAHDRGLPAYVEGPEGQGPEDSQRAQEGPVARGSEGH